MKTWVKLYTEINRDPTMGELTLAQKGVWMMLLALAGEIDARDENDLETGELDTIARVAWSIRCTKDELNDALAALEERGMVEERDGILWLPNYAKRQRRAPSDGHIAVAERVKRHRDKFLAPRNEDVTPLQDDVTSLESESDTETDNTSPSAERVTDEPKKPATSKQKVLSSLGLAIARVCEMNPDTIDSKHFWQINTAANVLGRAGHEPEQIVELYGQGGKWYTTFPGLDARTGNTRPPRLDEIRNGIDALKATGKQASPPRASPGPPRPPIVTEDWTQELTTAKEDGNGHNARATEQQTNRREPDSIAAH
ncbi:MAG: hypothetical protein WC683_18895 [bacterium]